MLITVIPRTEKNLEKKQEMNTITTTIKLYDFTFERREMLEAHSHDHRRSADARDSNSTPKSLNGFSINFLFFRFVFHQNPKFIVFLFPV